MKYLLPALLLSVLAATAQAQTVALTGMLGNRALLIVDGKAPKTVAPGDTYEGVKVVSTAGDQAVLEIGGKRQTLRVGEAPASVGTKGKSSATANKIVLAGEAFRKAAPYNPLFEEAFQLMRDFWSVPEYDDMMKACQREFCAVFQDGANPVDAVREIQREHEAILEALLERLARGGARILAGQGVEQAVHRRFLGFVLHGRAAAVLHQPDRFLDQVAGDLLDIAADIADFGELGRLVLHERRVG